MAEALVLTGRLDITAVGQLYEHLRTRLTDDVTLNLEKVTSIDALCVQTLVAASREIRANGRQFTLSNVSDCVVGQLKILGFSPESLMGQTP